MKAWMAICAALVIFIAGAVTGSLAHRLYQSHLRPVPNHPPLTTAGPGWSQRIEYLRRLDKDLKLTTDQRERIDRIINESQERMTGLWEGFRPKAHEEFQKTRERIKAVLNPEQGQAFEEIMRARGPRKPEDRSGRERRHFPSTNPPPPHAPNRAN